MIAALYVQTGGVYYGLPDVDPWDEERDARQYAGPWPVVAHPPCARCYGGVLEHPADSRAFYHYELPIPRRGEGWIGGLFDEGWSCYVEQGRYGFPARKATWLYAHGCVLPPMRWGRVNDRDARGEFTWTRKPGARRRVASPRNFGRIDGWRDEWAGGYKIATSITPPAFRDVLLEISRSALPSLAILP